MPAVQIGVDQLLVTLQPWLNRFHSYWNCQAVWAELMTRMDQVVAEQDNGFRRRQRVTRKGWIRDEAY